MRDEGKPVAIHLTSGASGMTDLFWLVMHEPGCVPERKGPWPLADTRSILREFIRARPTAYVDYVTIGSDGPEIQHGPELLQMLDGRSMSLGRAHNRRTRAAHAPHHAAQAVLAGDA